ncbi:hypothetical protein AcW1_003543 [Taiwanofungus camphoratus]|nr:hypothetical protein AcW1_003543 [Antrodia cinnamomea]
MLVFDNMSLSMLLLEAGVIYGVTCTLWRLFKRLVMPSPLDNIPGPPRKSFIKGNLEQVFDRHGWDFQREISEKYGSVVRLHGLFGAKRLFVFDPAALHSIIVKDQDVYGESSMGLTSKHLIFGPGLLATIGAHHRKQRKLLNPVFSISHMRHMLPVFYKVTGELQKAIASKVTDGPKELDMLEWMSRTALELIGQGGLGYSFDPLVEDIDNSLGDAMKALVPALFSLAILRRSLPYVTKLGPPAFRKRLVRFIPSRRIQRLREIVDTIDRTTREVWQAKKAALERGDEAVLQQVGEGKDIMSKLLQANMETCEDDRLPDEELLAQMATLIFAATDTTSSALARILHLLAQHPDVQGQLRQEVIAARNGRDGIPYDELVELPYLDAVCRETLRLYSPANWVTRTTRKDIVMPLSNPIKGVDGRMMHEIFVPNNTDVVVGILASNRNPAIWGDEALEWKPERWLSPLPESVTAAHIPGVYSHLMTFLGGSRACIGFKFSQMEMKVVLSVLLESFKFSLSDKAIVWNISGVSYPTVGPTDVHAQLPLMVEVIKSI